METGIILLTIGLYGLAIYVGIRERTALYVLGLLAGQLSTLASPLWQLLYRFSYSPDMSPLLMYLDRPLPQTVFLSGWLTTLPGLLILYISRRRTWYTSYLAALMLGAIFLVYYLVLEMIGTRGSWWAYSDIRLPLNMSSTLLAAIMNALVSMGILAVLHYTRRYTASSLILFFLPIPLILRLFVNGILGAPLYTVLLMHSYLPNLRTQSWAATIGVLGMLALLSWAMHLIAGTLERQGERYVM